MDKEEVTPMTQDPAPKASGPQITTPMAIIIAGVLVMVGIMLSHRGSTSDQTKTLSEQVGVSKSALDACVKSTDESTTNTRIQASVAKAMSGVPDNQRGTPYSIVIGPNGFKTDIRGADSYEHVKAIVDSAMQGKLAKDSAGNNISELYTGTVDLSEPTDHIQGSANASVTIIEYSDFECPYCKQFQPTIERIMKEDAPNVRWIYRHFPLHQHSFEMLVAADCVGKLKGDPAFFKYGDLLFGLQDAQDAVSGKL